MNSPAIVSLRSEALYGKSQVFIKRGFRALDSSDQEEYQLWASMALELLGKAALAGVHPALVADPQHFESLFAACGRVISADTKTITAKTLFLRLTHLSKQFDTDHQKFCEQISLRRNAEIHSGESPFSGMAPEAWERQFWSVADCILQMQGESLESWLGAEKAKAPKEVIAKAASAREWEVKDRISRRRAEFEKNYKSPSKLKKAREIADKLDYWDVGKFFGDDIDREWFVSCPACGCNAPIAGAFWEEEVLEPDDPDNWMDERVRATYVSRHFYCPTCILNLSGDDEVRAAGLPAEFVHEEVREREFEPEYGND